MTTSTTARAASSPATEDAEGGAHAFTYDAARPARVRHRSRRPRPDAHPHRGPGRPRGRAVVARRSDDHVPAASSTRSASTIQTITEPAGGETVDDDQPRRDAHRRRGPTARSIVQRRAPDPRFGMQAPFTSLAPHDAAVGQDDHDDRDQDGHDARRDAPGDVDGDGQPRRPHHHAALHGASPATTAAR